jgi:hypothetical protein
MITLPEITAHNAYRLLHMPYNRDRFIIRTYHDYRALGEPPVIAYRRAHQAAERLEYLQSLSQDRSHDVIHVAGVGHAVGDLRRIAQAYF